MLKYERVGNNALRVNLTPSIYVRISVIFREIGSSHLHNFMLIVGCVIDVLCP